MCGNVFSGLLLVRIIEVPDKRGPDNRGCTVLEEAHPPSDYIIPCITLKGWEMGSGNETTVYTYRTGILSENVH